VFLQRREQLFWRPADCQKDFVDSAAASLDGDSQQEGEQEG